MLKYLSIAIVLTFQLSIAGQSMAAPDGTSVISLRDLFADSRVKEPKFPPREAPYSVIARDDTRQLEQARTASGQSPQPYDAEGPRTIRYPSGIVYRGDIADYKPQGHGRFDFPNGDYYVGAVDDGYADGIGEFQFANGDYYWGSFTENFFDGPGIYFLKSQSITLDGLFDLQQSFKGRIWSEKKVGNQIIRFDYYGDAWLHGEDTLIGNQIAFDELGTLTRSTYDRQTKTETIDYLYFGEFDYGVPHGEGIMLAPIEFKGEFKDGEPSFGEFIDIYKQTYRGPLRHWKLEGEAQILASSGTAGTATFKGGKRVSHNLFGKPTKQYSLKLSGAEYLITEETIQAFHDLIEMVIYLELMEDVIDFANALPDVEGERAMPIALELMAFAWGRFIPIITDPKRGLDTLRRKGVRHFCQFEQLKHNRNPEDLKFWKKIEQELMQSPDRAFMMNMLREEED